MESSCIQKVLYTIDKDTMNINHTELYDQDYEKEIEANNLIFSDFENNIKYVSYLEKNGILTLDKKILEVGCGTGYFLNWLKHRGYNHIIGADIAISAIDYAKDHFKPIRFDLIEENELIYSENSFDIVLSFDVVEHIIDQKNHFKQVHKILFPGGYYCFATPLKELNTLFNILNKKNKIYHPSLQNKIGLELICKQTGFSKSEFVKLSYTLSNKQIKKIKSKHLGCFLPFLKIVILSNIIPNPTLFVIFKK